MKFTTVLIVIVVMVAISLVFYEFMMPPKAKYYAKKLTKSVTTKSVRNLKHMFD